MVPTSTYKKYLNPLGVFNTKRTRDIFQVNPTLPPQREEASEIHIQVFDFSGDQISEQEFTAIDTCFPFRDNGNITWINIDGIRKKDIETICSHFGIHFLIIEDILSVGQRPKMDEMDPVLFCLLNMLYFNEKTGAVETEQISIVLGKDFVISFQEDSTRDVFDPIRDKLRANSSQTAPERSRLFMLCAD